MITINIDNIIMFVKETHKLKITTLIVASLKIGILFLPFFGAVMGLIWWKNYMAEPPVVNNYYYGNVTY